MNILEIVDHTNRFSSIILEDQSRLSIVELRKIEEDTFSVKGKNLRAVDFVVQKLSSNGNMFNFLLY